MNRNMTNLELHLLNGLKDKVFSYHVDKTSRPMLGRQGNNYFINNGRLAGSVKLEMRDENTVECSIQVSWDYQRDKYELIQTAQENRTDYGIYIFTATLVDSTQIVSIQEVDWIPFQDPNFQQRLDINHDSAKYAKASIKECLIKPLSGHITGHLNSKDENFLTQYFQDRNITIYFNGDIVKDSTKVTIRDIGGNAIGIGDISGTVTATIGKLTESEDPEAHKLAELLTPLQSAITSDTHLSEKDKAKALKQVQALAEAGQNSKDEEKKDLADDAITMLKGIVSGLPGIASAAKACQELLPLITPFFGL